MNEFQNEKRLSLFRPWELLGFGCHCAWMLVLVIDPTTLSGNEMDVFGGRVSLRVIMMAGIALCYVGIFLLYRKSKAVPCGKGLIVAAGFSGFLGTLVSVGPWDGALVFALWPVSALLVGFSYGFSMVAGNLFWTKNRPERAMLQLTVSSVFAVAVYALAMALPYHFRIVLVSVLPLVGDFILILSKGGRSRPAAAVERASLMADRARMLFGAFASMLSYGCVLALGALNGHSAESWFSLWSISAVIALGFLFAAGCSVAFSLRRNTTEWLGALDRIAPVVTCLGVVGLAVFCFDGLEYVALFQSIAVSGAVLTEQFFWVLNAEVAYRDRKDWAQAVPAAVGCAQWTGLLIGSVSISFFHESMLMPTLFFAVFVFLLFVRAFVFRREDAMKLVLGWASSEADDIHEIKCMEVAKRHALSARETDVFMMLAQGRTMTYIQNQLVLSQSTVKTHARSIYKKLNVSSKQELIDLVENLKI